MFTSPGEILFSFKFLSIHYYSLCIALGIILGLSTAYFITKKYYKDFDANLIFDISIPIIIGGIIGARLYYCIMSYPYYLYNPIEILQIYKGGLSIHGAILGGLIFGILYAKKNSLPILKLCDIFTFALVIGQIFGRWGNFFNSEAFGKPCNHFLKLYIPIEKRPSLYIDYNYFHPTFLYEIILNIFILLILYQLLKKNLNNGIIFFSYLILYSAARIFVESIRIDSVLYIFGIPIATITSILIIILSLIALYKLNLR